MADVSATMTIPMDVIIRQVADACTGGAVSVISKLGEEVAGNARRAWYGPGGLRRVTGKSGNIVSRTVITTEMVRVSDGSTDLRTSGGKPLVVFFHPARFRKRQVTHAEFWAAPERLQANYHPRRGDVGAGPFIWETNSDAKPGFLLQTLVRAPLKARVLAAMPELRVRIARKLKGG